MKLYNTLTKHLDELTPQAPGQVKVYTCGPTVYDYAHVGHWFTYVRADILIRALRAVGLTPTWVMNITDVGHLVSDADDGEDKLEKGARREGKTAWDVAEFYTKDFLHEMQQLNITTPSHIVKATDHIAEQIALVQTLEDKGFTYIIDDGVYYDTSKFPRYADFAQLDLNEQQAGARVGFNTQKRNASDFALWKFSPKDGQRDMEWDSPWGKGFPGWHIECSAMSMKYLGDTLDIHTGGIDHIPVHHTNEIAQSEAATGKPFAKYWMHTNHVLVDGEKVSKSLGNGVRLPELLEKDISLEAFRVLVLESHYRSQSKFSFDGARAAAARLKDLRALAALQWQPHDNGAKDTEAHKLFTEAPQEITRMLANDLDTPSVMAYLSAISKQLQTAPLGQHEVSKLTGLLNTVDTLLGLTLGKTPDITDEQKQLIQERETARSAKAWAESDRIRATLFEQGIEVSDTDYGTIWQYR